MNGGGHEEVIVDVLNRVGGWVRTEEVLRQLARRGVEISEAELLDVALDLEGRGRVRSTLYLQAVPA